MENVIVVGEANDIGTAKEEISKLEFEHAIYDVVMPNGIGIELLEYTKMIKPSAKVTMMTNYTAADYEKKCLRAGADYFFSKSDLDEMLLMIERLSKEENNDRK